MICWVDRVDNIRECTLGFVTVSNGDTSFVTASHCSQTHGALDSTTYFQPNDSVITYYVGSESLDPAFVTDATCPAGPAGCRNSDVTLVKAAAPAALGRMGRPVTCFCPSWGNPPDSAYDYLGGQGPYAYFTIQADTIATDEVWMLGAKSGETYGFLVSSCVDATTESGAVIKCQVVASYPSTFGDSGAPVFFWPDTPPYDQYVDLLGVHFGATTDSALGCQGGCGVFSPIAAVKQELGNVPTH